MISNPAASNLYKCRPRVGTFILSSLMFNKNNSAGWRLSVIL